MFYQVNATAVELKTLQAYAEARERPCGGWIRFADVLNEPKLDDEDLVPLIKSFQGDDERSKLLKHQAAIIQMRSILSSIHNTVKDANVPLVYYLLARYYQQVFGWATLQEHEREAISPFLEALFADERLARSTPLRSSLDVSFPTVQQKMLELIPDTLLVSRLLASQFSLIRYAQSVSLVLRLEETPIISMRDRCCECGASSTQLKRCAGCKVVFYCSRKCQASNWKHVHKQQCQKYATCAGNAIASMEPEKQQTANKAATDA